MVVSLSECRLEVYCIDRSDLFAPLVARKYCTRTLGGTKSDARCDRMPNRSYSLNRLSWLGVSNRMLCCVVSVVLTVPLGGDVDRGHMHVFIARDERGLNLTVLFSLTPALVFYTLHMLSCIHNLIYMF